MMQFVMNELSFHGQFVSSLEFSGAVSTIMQIRQAIQRAGAELFCHRSLANAQVTADHRMPEAVQGLSRDHRQAWMSWLNKRGPFWTDQRQHRAEDWFEADGEMIVTDSGLGEIAWSLVNGRRRDAVSVAPSDWIRTPLVIKWRKESQDPVDVSVVNHWTLDSVQTLLQGMSPSYDSWGSLEICLRKAHEALIFSDDFMKLDGYPFVKSVADGIWDLLQVLHVMSDGIDGSGHRTRAAARMYDVYFTGYAPCFTDESTANKHAYRQQMTFPSPINPGEPMFCPWHGKVNTPSNFPPVRIHFTWPVMTRGQVCVPYVGRKLTTK